jgi:hypothetical protein
MLFDGHYRWLTLDNVVSEHIRSSIRGTVQHAYRQKMRCAKTFWCGDSNKMGSVSQMVRLFLTSGLRGVELAVNNRLPTAVLFYPYLRFCMLEAEFKCHLR